MSGDDGEDREATAASEIGYRRPPADHRFKKGASGNPGGRPKKKPPPKRSSPSAALVADYVLHEAYRTISLRENDRPIQMPLIQAVIRSLGVAALKGNHRAQVALTGLVRDAEQGKIDEHVSTLKSFLDYKLGWTEILRSGDREPDAHPELPIHPDDLVIDIDAGEVIFNGPFGEVEKAKWAKFEQLRADQLAEIQDHRKLMKEMPEHRAFLEDDIAHCQWLVDLVDRTIPSEEVRRATGFNIHEWRAKQLRIHKAQGKTERPRFRSLADKSKKEGST